METTPLVEGIHATGAINSSWDPRDHKYNKLGTAPQPFDWNIGFDIGKKLQTFLNNPSFTIPVENQGQSGSCGGQAVRYYLEVLFALRNKTFKRLSAKNPYSQIFYPGGGTTIRDVGNIASRKGICSEELIPSYDKGSLPSEAFMEGISANHYREVIADAVLSEEFGYAFPARDIDSIATAIRDNNGCILQINGQNNGTWLSPFPTPPQDTEWSHFIYAGKAELLNGQKYIGFINSWGESTGTLGWQWLPVNYFTSGNVTNALVFYDKALYSPYVPGTTQKALTWLQKFMNWFSNFQINFPYENTNL